jgi:hypothetical protein
MTSRATFCLQRRVLICERPLLIGVTLNTRGVSPGRESRLFRFKSPVRVVTIATLNRPFQNLMVKRFVEIRVHFGMATDTELSLTQLQHCDGGVTGLLSISLRYEGD